MENQPPPTPQPQPPAEVPSPMSDELSSEDKNLGMLAHLITFSGYVVPLGNIIGPLVIYFIKKDNSPYIRHHAAEALNFQLSVLIYAIISAILVFIIIGVPMLIALLICDLVFTIIAAVRANEGTWYRYPLCIRFVS